MLALFQVTSTILYGFILVVILTVALSTLFGSLAARELKKPVRRLPKIRGSNCAQRRKELALSGRKKI